MYILGLNAFHGDSAACLYKDDKLVLATEEERLRRVKHWAGFPTESIKVCLNEAGIKITDIDHITISRNPSAKLISKIKHTLTKMHNLSNIFDRIRNTGKVASVKDILAKEFDVNKNDIKAEIHNIEHHRAHMASAFFVSPFKEAAILSIDGFGDFTSTMTGFGKESDITILDSVTYPHSLGIFYTAFTQYLGFSKYGDEYKVMGLAPYGEPKYVDKVKDVVELTNDGLFKLNQKYFTHSKSGVSMTWEDGYPNIERIFSDYMVEKFGIVRKKDEPIEQYHMDLAASVQKVTEITIFHILNYLQEKTGFENVCIAGGVGQNSVANGKIYLNTKFKNVYLPPAATDAGTSLGSALWLKHQINKEERLQQAMFNADTGQRFTDEQIISELKEQNLEIVEKTDDEINELVADQLIDAGVVGWFKGGSEFGPRALGYRSILADPRRDDAKEILNVKIKKREKFRPFAPSILSEYVDDYFEQSKDVPFMEKVYQIKEEKRKEIPAVTHVDGSGRLQSVHKEINPKYHAMIRKFYEKTGVPIVLNTSFNENEPIVNTPKEAVATFLRTKMDLLILENFVVKR
ncbi:MAG: carbamoyltransferase [Bacteroidales bacterium]|nr:carbamoyltransferase [Bacteroidales bacterium]